jgi:DNA polymerase-3 subunit delta
MARPTADEVLGTTTVVTGAEEFLAERSIAAVRDAVRRADRDADVSELAAAELGPGVLVEIASPSLFASMRCVVVRALEELPDDAVEPLLAYVAAPAPDVALVLHHTGGQKGKAVLDRLRKAGAAQVQAKPLKSYELARWVAAEFRRHRVQVGEPVAKALIGAVGDEMRALAGAVDQLVSDAGDEPVTEELVHRYFGGPADVKGFAVADAAIAGKTAAAFEALRWAFTVGVDPVLVTSAMAGGLRAVARRQGAPMGLREADLAREVGVPPWKLRQVTAQARGWSARGLAAAIRAAAQADADVKGAGGDREWACERLVISVLRARARS